MQCDENHPMIEAYFDGELEDEARFKVERHLEDCAACAGLVQQLRAEGEVYVGYEPQVEIKPELWAMVQTRIGESRPALSMGFFTRLHIWLRTTFAVPQVSGWATAALIVLAVGLTVTFMKYVRPGEEKVNSSVSPSSQASQASPAQPQTILSDEKGDAEKPKDKTVMPGANVELTTAQGRGKSPLSRPKPLPRLNTADQLVREAEQKYLAAIAMLTRTVEHRRSRLDAPTLARLEQSLDAVDRSISNTRKVVRQHPADPVAVQYMLNAYSKKVDVLREVIGHQ